ncbi:MAG: hypothetical protein QOH95_444 [Gaiellaceae bacterium]|nr:hypothetical protein [Gaiellaceae bacterium]
MTRQRNRQIAPLAVLAAALIGAGAAYAATQIHGSTPGTPASAGVLSGTQIASGGAATTRGDGHGGPGGRGFGHGPAGDELTAAANYLGVTETALVTQLQGGKTLAQVAGATSGKSAAGLVDALVAAEKTEIAAAVTAGRITQAQADQVLPTLTARFTAFVNNTEPEHGRGGPGGPGGHGFGHGPGGDELTAAATYLGVTETALVTQLQAGKTLAQVADATSGKSSAGLIDALVAAEKKEIAAEVTAGRLTQAQADQIIPTLTARFKALANGTRPSHDGSPGFRQNGGTHI